MRIKAVIFDLDGTITRPYFDFDKIREEMGLAADSGPVLESMLKMDRSRYEAAERILSRHEQKAVEESELNPGARETLRALRESGIRIGILTRNKKSNAEAVAVKHGLEFDGVVGRDEGPAKPDPFGVLRLCEEFGIEPGESMVVGDYVFDLLSARAGGAAAVLLKNGHQPDEFAEHADFCVENIEQILKIVGCKKTGEATK